MLPANTLSSVYYEPSFLAGIAVSCVLIWLFALLPENEPLEINLHKDNQQLQAEVAGVKTNTDMLLKSSLATENSLKQIIESNKEMIDELKKK